MIAPAPLLRWFAFLAAFACLCASGCSAIRTIYNQAEHLAAWRVDDYFQLTDTQREFFRTRFAVFHRWHRQHALDRYLGLLVEAQRRIERGPQVEDVDWVRQQVRLQARAALVRADHDIATLLATLSESQIARARQRFERDNRKYAQEHGVGAPPDEQRRLRVRLDIDRIEHWTGSLSRAQKVRIAELSAALPLDADAHARDRQRRQGEFLALLGQRSDRERFAARLRQWLHDWDAARPADLAPELLHYDRARAAMLTEVYALLDSAQRREVQARVHWYADAMRDLAASTPR